MTCSRRKSLSQCCSSPLHGEQEAVSPHPGRPACWKAAPKPRWRRVLGQRGELRLQGRVTKGDMLGSTSPCAGHAQLSWPATNKPHPICLPTGSSWRSPPQGNPWAIQSSAGSSHNQGLLPISSTTRSLKWETSQSLQLLTCQIIWYVSRFEFSYG